MTVLLFESEVFHEMERGVCSAAAIDERYLSVVPGMG